MSLLMRYNVHVMNILSIDRYVENIYIFGKIIIRGRVRPCVPLVVYERVAVYDFLNIFLGDGYDNGAAAGVIHSCYIGDFAQLHTYKLYL